MNTTLLILSIVPLALALLWAHRRLTRRAAIAARIRRIAGGAQ